MAPQADSASAIAPPDAVDAGGAGLAAPSISLPKGGGAIRGIGEKFAANPVTGTGSMSVPIATSPGRSGFGPQLSLSYDSGAGNGPFGFGWSLSLPVDHPQDRQGPAAVPRRRGVGRLPPLRRRRPGAGARQDADGNWVRETRHDRTIDGVTYRSTATARASRGCSRASSAGRDRRRRRRPLALDLQGQHPHPLRQGRRTRASPIPPIPSRIFSWLICETRDDKGNAVVYDYKPEDGAGVDLAQRARAQPRRPRRPAPHGQPLPQAHPLRQPRAAAGRRRAAAAHR